MTKKSKYLLIQLIFAFSISKSQNIIPSTAYIQSCYNKHECFSISNSALVFFNPSNNELVAQFDFNKFKIGNDTLDEWLKDLTETNLVFKGNLNTNDLLSLSHHNSKSIIVNGIINFNGVSKPYSLELNIFEVPKDASLLFKENSQDYFDRVNANIQIAFYPKYFNIDKKHQHYKKSISIAVYRGYINELKQGQEFLIKDKNNNN